MPSKSGTLLGRLVGTCLGHISEQQWEVGMKGLVCLITHPMGETGGKPKCRQRSVLGAMRTVKPLRGLTERGKACWRNLRRLGL